MRRFTVSTDSTCDLYQSYIEKHDIQIVRHVFHMEKDGRLEERTDAFLSEEEYAAFYDELRAGAFARTSMLNYERHFKHFLRLAEEGARDVLHFTISSGLSPTKDVAAQAASDVKKKYPKFNVLVCDPLTATVGQGALVMLAAKMRDEGRKIEETYKYVNSLRLHIQHFIVADDLNYLKKGGRISPTAAAVGGMLGIKPIISFDNEGKLFVLTKVRGTKKALSFLKEKLLKEGPDELHYVFVVHTGNFPAAKELCAFVESTLGYAPFCSVMGPVIGAHLGPGAFALGYISKSLRNTF